MAVDKDKAQKPAARLRDPDWKGATVEPEERAMMRRRRRDRRLRVRYEERE